MVGESQPGPAGGVRGLKEGNRLRPPIRRGDTLEVAPAPALPLFRAPRSPASPPLTEGDHARLGAQQAAVLRSTVGRGWLTLRAVAEATGAPEASVSARLRQARGQGYGVERRREGALYLYRVTEMTP